MRTFLSSLLPNLVEGTFCFCLCLETHLHIVFEQLKEVPLIKEQWDLCKETVIYVKLCYDILLCSIRDKVVEGPQLSRKSIRETSSHLIVPFYMEMFSAFAENWGAGASAPSLCAIACLQGGEG